MTGLYKYGLLVSGILMSAAASAQKVQARIDSVPSDGFYRILVSPELARHTRTDLGDIRIRDEQEQPVPYRLERRLGYSTYSWLELPIVAVEQDSAHTRIVFAMKQPSSSGFELFFANTTAQRRAALSGSNDRRQWYSLDDSLLLAPVRRDAGTAHAHIAYPPSKYRYIRLELYNGKSAPLEPLNAGIFMGEPRPQVWNMPDSLSFADSSSGGRSFIRINNEAGNLMERLLLEVQRPKFFSRNVTLLDEQGRLWTTGVVTNQQRELEFPPTRARTMTLIVENSENPRLELVRISAQQRAYELIAYLEAGRHYRISAGDSSATAPAYDLSGFSDSATGRAQPVGFGNLEQLVEQKQSDQRPWIWIALIAGAGMLAWFAFSLLRDVQRSKRAGDR